VGDRENGAIRVGAFGCARKLSEVDDSYKREVRDLPCFEFRTMVVIELYGVRCPDCGVKAEKASELASKAPFSSALKKPWVGCESAACSSRRPASLLSRTLRCVRSFRDTNC